jgi:hypothetical protein
MWIGLLQQAHQETLTQIWNFSEILCVANVLYKAWTVWIEFIQQL